METEELNLEQSLLKIEGIVPSDVGNIGKILATIVPENMQGSQRIAVTVESTVCASTLSSYFDKLITRHRPSDQYQGYLGEEGIFLYVIEDIVPKGSDIANKLTLAENVSLAEVLKLKDVSTIQLSYDGYNNPYGALMGTFDPSDFNILYFLGISEIQSIFGHLTRGNNRDSYPVGFGEGENRYTINVSHNEGGPREIQKVAVASCSGLTPEIIKQIYQAGADTLISFGINQESVDLADNLGINILGISDYLSHMVGLRRIGKESGIKFYGPSFLW